MQSNLWYHLETGPLRNPSTNGSLLSRACGRNSPLRHPPKGGSSTPAFAGLTRRGIRHSRASGNPPSVFPGMTAPGNVSTSHTLACLIGAIALAVAFAGISFAQTPGLYCIDAKASHIEIHVFRGGFLSAFGDNHVIALNHFSGTAKSSGKTWEVDVVGESASLEVKDPKSAASTRAEVQSTMVGPTQLDVTRYPKIEVRAISLVPGGTGQSWRMIADVTLHGVTRRVEFPLAWSQDGNVLRVHGKKKLLLRDFKIEPISKGFGAVQVRNEFDLIYDIVLRRSS